MGAEFNVDLDMTLNGKTEELQSFLNVFKGYVDRKHFEVVNTEYYSKESLRITAWGPFYYTMLNDMDLFRDMAEAAPLASFKATLSGSDDYGIAQKLDAMLDNGILDISTYFEDDEVMGEIYAAYEEAIESSEEPDAISFDEFRFSNDHGFGTREEMEYDPIAKKYILRL